MTHIESAIDKLEKLADKLEAREQTVITESAEIKVSIAKLVEYLKQEMKK